MPSDIVATIVSTGIGVSVVAGVLSGVCYVLVHGLTKPRCGRPSGLEWHCAVCGQYLRLKIKGHPKVVICERCEKRVCKRRCSKRNLIRKGWICYSCFEKPVSFKGILKNLWLPFVKINSETSEPMEKELPTAHLEKDYIRDLIENLVATVVGGSVDDASVFRIYHDKYYKDFFDKYHQGLSDAIANLNLALQVSPAKDSSSSETPTPAHARLKHLIEKLLVEVNCAPKSPKQIDNKSADEEDRTYEELLATAILNKIIRKREDHTPLSSPSSEYDIDDKSEENWTFKSTKTKSEYLESTSPLSLNELLENNLNHNKMKYVDTMSLTIEQRLEHPVFYEDDYSKNYTNNKDESNWHLKKRQFYGKNSPVPVPMLVPNPLTSAKVLIGDKEIDETSDLSDGISENDISLTTNLNIHTNFGTDEATGHSDEDTSFDSGVREDRDEFTDEVASYYNETKKYVDNTDEITHDMLLSSFDNVEQDTEYSEQYGSLPKTVVKEVSTFSYHPPMTDEQECYNLYQTYQDSSKQTKRKTTDLDMVDGFYGIKVSEEPDASPIKARTKQNVNKYQRYGRDYYTKQASIPSGTTRSNEVSFFSDIDNLEASCTYSSLPRSLYTARNATINFVSNPLLNFTNYRAT